MSDKPTLIDELRQIYAELKLRTRACSGRKPVDAPEEWEKVRAYCQSVLDSADGKDLHRDINVLKSLEVAMRFHNGLDHPLTPKPVWEVYAATAARLAELRIEDIKKL